MVMKTLYTILVCLTLCLFNSYLVQAQWQRQYPLAKLENVLDIDVSPDGFGFAVGTNDLILRLSIVSGEWELLPGYGESWDFEAVDYLDGSFGDIAVAGGEGLILTLDNGSHWEAIEGAPAGIHTIKIFSLSHIIVATDDDVYEWENDVWTGLNVNATAALKGAFILDDQTIWAYTFSTNPTIYRTTNGGTNWTSNAEIPRVDVVRFFDHQIGIALDGRDVYRSVNGGQNWTLIADNGLTNASNDLTFGSSANVLIAATLNAKPNISGDGGFTWTAVTTDLINQRNYSVTAVSNNDLWIGNDLSSVMHSTDGGMTWEETSGPTRNLIQDVYFLNRSTGFATGQKGLILRTMDGGENWEDITFGSRSYLSIHGLNVNDLWIGSNQRILHSIDTGNTWTEAVVFASGNINDVLAISHDRILAASTTGYIYLSKNAGMTWDSVYNSGLQMRSLAKINDQSYMATGYNGVILRSDDQGQSWHPVTIPEPGLQYEQSYFINGEGWLVTSSFKKSMWHTTNGGMTWDTLALPIDRFWDGVYFITPDTGIVVARSTTEGRAYITFDGGHHWQSGYITSFPLFGVTGVPNPNGTAWIFGFGSDIEVLPYCNTLPVISNFTGDLFPCEKDTVLYTITSQDVDLFTWHFPPGWIIIGNGNNDSVRVVAGANSGNITVFGTNTCGVSGQLSFSAGPQLLPFILGINGDETPCVGEITSYSAQAFNVSDYVWSLPADWLVEGNANQSTIMVHVGTLDGEISVSGSNSCGSAQSPAPYFVSVGTLPTIQLLSGDLSPCPGDTVTYTFLGDASSTFVFTAPEGLDDWIMLPGPGVRFIAGHESGIFHIAAVNDCGSTPLALPLDPLDVPQFIGILADGAKLYPTATGIAYQWYQNDLPIPGATNDTLIPLFSGTYTVLVSFDNGCSVLSSPVSVSITATVEPSSYLLLSVYPLPASEELYVKGIDSAFDYVILDLSGRIIRKEHALQNQLPVGFLSDGIYFLKVRYHGSTFVTKFIKS
jgi:photosystem II stability/assembly factor-like uncharacterized protein